MRKNCPLGRVRRKRPQDSVSIQGTSLGQFFNTALRICYSCLDYQNHEAYTPSIDELNDIPNVLNRADRIMVTARADIRNPDQEEPLAEIVQSLPVPKPLEDEDHAPEPVTNALHAESQDMPLDPIRCAVLDILSLVSETTQSVSAKKVYQALKLNCDSELWYMALVNEVYGLPDTERKNVHMEFVERRDPTFSGNFWVSDIILRHTSGINA